MKQQLLLFYFLFQFTLGAQNISIKKMDVRNGLADNSVRTIMQDKKGYLWFGTLNGISRFDGKSFKNYVSIPGDTTSLHSCRIIKLEEDKKGFIWCWSDDYSIQRINPVTNNVINLYSRLINKGNKLKDFKMMSNGEIWVWGEHSCALLKYKDKQGNLIAEDITKSVGLDDSKSKLNFLFEDQFKNIWIGTRKGLFKINYNNGQRIIKRFFFNSDFISYDTFGNNNWFGTKSDGLFKYVYENKTIIPLTKQKINTPIFQMTHIDAKTLVLGSDGLLYVYDVLTNKISEIVNEQLHHVTNFYKDTSNAIWIFNDKRGVFKYSNTNQKLEYFNLNAENRTFMRSYDKLIILEDSNHNIWIGEQGGGLFFYKRKENKFVNYQYQENNNQSISSNIILSLFEDASKNLWIGNMYGGVNKINLSTNNFHWIQPVSNPVNSFENEIRAVVKDSKERIWLGSRGGKLFCYQDNKLLYTFPNNLSLVNQSKLKDINFYSLYIDRQDNLWMGTRGKGLFVFKNISTTNPGQLELIHFENLLAHDLNDIYSITQDKMGQYWIASHGFGLFVISNPFTNPKVENFRQGTSENQLLSNFTRKVYFDRDDNLWIATIGGINLLMADQLKAVNKKFIAIKNEKAEISSLSFYDVDHIFQASDRSIYVSTLGGGINKLKYQNMLKKNFVWEHLTKADGLSTNICYSVLEDFNKNLWISTSLGLNKYNPKTSKFENFFIEKDNGLNYFTENCDVKLKNGELLFGYNSGFLVFNPRRIMKNKSTHPLVFSKFFVNGNEQIPGKSGIIKKNIEYENEVDLSYDQNNIRFDFSVLDFKNPEKIQYSYKLDNFDDKWSKPLTSNSALYQNLPSGEYTLMVKATNGDGIEMPEIIKFKVNIKPPFFKSNLGYFLIALFFGFLFYLFLFLYRKQLAAKQEALFTDRLSEEKLKYYTNISHEFKTPLTLIACQLQDIADNSNIELETKTTVSQIQKSTNYLSNLIDQILDFRKIREEKMQLILTNINIVDFISGIKNQFLPLANKENISLSFITDKQEIYGYIDERIMKKVLYNLISNAIKFTPSGKSISIVLKVAKTDRTFKVKVVDEGIGMSMEDQQHLFERFGRSTNSTGLGLSYVKELVNCHRGTIKVKSDLNNGSCFIINIPITLKDYTGLNVIVSDEIKTTEHITENLDSESPVVNETAEPISKLKYSILIIDDNEEMRDYLCNKFRASFNVFSAKNGEEGVQLAIKEIPDIIVSDLMMPVMDGMGVVKIIKENFNTCHIPIILLTANASENTKMEGVEVGADDYITKPFNFMYLKVKIESLIAQRNKMIQSFNKNPELSMDIITNDEEDKIFIKNVKQLIEDNIGEANFNIDFIANEMGLSRSVFYKRMKGITNITPHEFISEVQMKKAALMLKNTNYTITEISVICGFSDTSYFSKIFKKHFGYTPKGYQLKEKE